VRAKDTTHAYHEWRDRILDHHLRVILSRLEQRVRRDGVQAVLSDDQRLAVLLTQFLDEGGETTEYIRDIYDAE
jgi:hypothetical protein